MRSPKFICRTFHRWCWLIDVVHSSTILFRFSCERPRVRLKACCKMKLKNWHFCYHFGNSWNPKNHHREISLSLPSNGQYEKDWQYHQSCNWNEEKYRTKMTWNRLQKSKNNNNRNGYLTQSIFFYWDWFFRFDSMRYGAFDVLYHWNWHVSIVVAVFLLLVIRKFFCRPSHLQVWRMKMLLSNS